MILFQSPLPSLFLLTAALFTLWGSIGQKRLFVLIGSIALSVGVVIALIQGASLYETLSYVLLILLLSIQKSKSHTVHTGGEDTP